jgi:hypothetical protein
MSSEQYIQYIIDRLKQLECANKVLTEELYKTNQDNIKLSYQNRSLESILREREVRRENE